MNIILIYLLLVKATLTSFSGMSSLPVIRGDFVLKYHLLTDRELNTAVAAGRLGPGPIGLYVVSVGYFAAGLPGACAGWLAMVTPAFLIIPMLRFVGKRAQHPRVKSVIRTMMLASAGLLIFAALPLARDAVTDAITLAILVASFLAITFTRIDSIWIILGSALAGLLSLVF
jgi:chromate transporter